MITDYVEVLHELIFRDDVFRRRESVRAAALTMIESERSAMTDQIKSLEKVCIVFGTVTATAVIENDARAFIRSLRRKIESLDALKREVEAW